MSEVIKVEAGQVWQLTGALVTVYSVETNGRINTCRDGLIGDDGFAHAGDDCCWEYADSFKHGKLISPATVKVAADRSGCKAWCGMSYSDARKNGYPGDCTSFRAIETWAAPAWCTPACRDAQYPPMGEANPVPIVITSDPAMSPTEVIMRQGAEMLGRIVNLAKPEPAKAPKCGWSGANHTGAVLLRVARTGEAVTVCDGCWLSNEAVIADNIGGGIAPYTGPERLEKPKMASDSWWPDFAEDGR